MFSSPVWSPSFQSKNLFQSFEEHDRNKSKSRDTPMWFQFIPRQWQWITNLWCKRNFTSVWSSVVTWLLAWMHLPPSQLQVHVLSDILASLSAYKGVHCALRIGYNAQINNTLEKPQPKLQPLLQSFHCCFTLRSFSVLLLTNVFVSSLMVCQSTFLQGTFPGERIALLLRSSLSELIVMPTKPKEN